MNETPWFSTVEECFPEASLVRKVAQEIAIGRVLVSSNSDEDPTPTANEYEGAYQYVIASIAALSFLEPEQLETVIMLM